jgi:hypothetical protein
VSNACPSPHWGAASPVSRTETVCPVLPSAAEPDPTRRLPPSPDPAVRAQTRPQLRPQLTAACSCALLSPDRLLVLRGRCRVANAPGAGQLWESSRPPDHGVSHVWSFQPGGDHPPHRACYRIVFSGWCIYLI